MTSAASTAAVVLSNSSPPKEVLAESPSRVLVDGYGRIGEREAACRRDAGNGARRVLVQAVRGVLGDDGRPGLGVVGCRYAVADGVV